MAQEKFVKVSVILIGDKAKLTRHLKFSLIFSLKGKIPCKKQMTQTEPGFLDLPMV